MCRQRLDAAADMPHGLREYLSAHGWHFSKRLCDYAVARMKRKGAKITPINREQAEELLKKHGVECSDFVGYDHVYVANMAKADYFGSSLETEKQHALFVRDYLTDEDGYDGIALTRYLSDCIGKGETPPWEDVL